MTDNNLQCGCFGFGDDGFKNFWDQKLIRGSNICVTRIQLFGGLALYLQAFTHTATRSLDNAKVHQHGTMICSGHFNEMWIQPVSCQDFANF